MDTWTMYRCFVNELPEGSDERRVMHALVYRDSPEPVTRKQLIEKVYGYVVFGTVTNNSVADRRIRKAIEALREWGCPIMSSASGKGYWMADKPGEIEIFIAELESRREKMADKIRAMRRMKDRLIRNETVYQPPLSLA